MLINYFIEGDLPASTDFSQGISEVAQDFGAAISFSFASSEGGTVAFEGLKAGGFTAGGGINYVASTNQISVTLTSVSGG